MHQKLALSKVAYLLDAYETVRDVGEWVSAGVGKRDDPEGDTAEMARLGW